MKNVQVDLGNKYSENDVCPSLLLYPVFNSSSVLDIPANMLSGILSENSARIAGTLLPKTRLVERRPGSQLILFSQQLTKCHPSIE